MTCSDYRPLLSAYLDRALLSDEQTPVARHVESCAACAAEVSALLRVKETLRAEKMPSIPADLIAAIEAQTIDQPSVWSWMETIWRWGPLLAGTFALAVWAFAVFQNVRLQMQEPRVPLQALLARAHGKPWSIDEDHRVAVHHVSEGETDTPASPPDDAAAPPESPPQP